MSGTELTLMSDPLRMLEWVPSVRFHPLAFGSIEQGATLGIGPPGALAIAADFAGAPVPRSIGARIDEEPAAAFCLAASDTGGVLGGEQGAQRPEHRPDRLLQHLARQIVNVPGASPDE